MSLLMKALEKAAQDRNKSPEISAARAPAAAMAGNSVAAESAAAPSSALTLEPIDPVAPRVEPVMPAASAKPGAAGAATAARGTQRSPDQARAAVVLSTKSAGGGAGAWISAHPVPFTAALAGAFAVGYGTYIYLQAAHPGLFIRTPAPVAAIKPAPGTPAPAPAESTAQGSTTADTSLIPAQSVFSSSPGTAAPASAAPAAPAPPSSLMPSQGGSIAAKPAPTVPMAPAAPAAVAIAPQARIVVSGGENTAPRVNPAVSDAYAALEAGRFDAAQRLYEQALRSEPNNSDALLGLAAIARYENRTEDASRHYLKILDVDPRHALAQTGLIALMGRADPQAAETRLKQLVAREPSPAMYFTLGNLYADQGLWSSAQQAYFQAHHLDAGNPDYAYNLAVALEHLGQQKLALGFYRRALQLAAGRGRANFNSAQAQARITQLAARLE